MPVSQADVAHLLRRVGFGATEAELNALSPLSLSQVYTKALAVRDKSPTPPSAVNDPALGTLEWERINAMKNWWTDRMVATSAIDTSKPSPLVEKMALFWHNHFATSGDKCYNGRAMWEQNLLFHTQGTGNFRTLCKAVSIGTAMLNYLDNESNTKWSPNQNFGRELMELFMLGVGNYTESDVVTSAAAWSGHGVQYGTNWNLTTYLFRPEWHDTQLRPFLGKTQVWNGPQIIDWILDNPATRTIAAKFICRKLWTWLVHPNPADNIVNDLAAIFISNKWAIMPVLNAMFRRAEFWSATARNGLVRTPVEYMVAAGRGVGVGSATLHPHWWDAMGQSLFYPPNVSGWRPNDYWISTSAATTRADFAENLYWQASNPSGPLPNLWKDIVNDDLAPAQRPDPTTVVTKAFRRMGVPNPAPETVTSLVAWCVANRHQWTSAEPWSHWGERAHLFRLVLTSPDMQMA